MFFKPKSVAIVGVSQNSRKIGHIIFKNFIESNIQAKVYPINPQADKILGYPCYKSVLDIPGPIDLAVLAVPSQLTLDTVKQCAQKKARGIIIVAGGFGETGEEGKQLEEEILEVSRANNMRIIGPNVIGIYDPYNGIDTLFVPRYRLMRPKRGKIAFISQSGAFGAAILDYAASQGIGVSKFVSIGNSLDVDAVDVLEYLENDKDSNCIMLYLEGLKPKEGKDFYNIIKRISLKKPIILLKGGLTNQGQKAAASHTGAISSQIEILQAVFKQTGVIQANDTLQLFDMARILSAGYIPKGRGIAIITNAGGFGVLTTDQLVQKGFELASLSEETVEFLKAKMPPAVSLANPIDLIGDADTERYRTALNKVLEDPNVDLVILIILLSLSFVESDIIDVINDAKVNYGKPIVVTTIGGDFTQMMIRMMEENQIPTFPNPQRTIDAVKALITYSDYCERKGECEFPEWST